MLFFFLFILEIIGRCSALRRMSCGCVICWKTW